MNKKHLTKTLRVMIYTVSIIEFFLSFPKFIYLKFLDGTNFDLWLTIHALFLDDNHVLKTYYQSMRDNLPNAIILLEIILNIIIILLSFKRFKKWWFYLFILINILITFMLIDCLWIYYSFE